MNEAMTNGAGNMRLDEKGLEAAAKALCIGLGSACPIPLFSNHHAVAEQIITAFFSSTMPEDVRELVERLQSTSAQGMDISGIHCDIELEAATALLSLSAENAELKAQMDGTAGVEHIGKAG